ncbi:MAG: GNAT family N-acetyltransferase, partial [bacterium]
MPPAQITPATSSPKLTYAARLFAEYARSIAPIAGASLSQQGFDAELACLPGKYAAQRGVIVLG